MKIKVKKPKDGQTLPQLKTPKSMKPLSTGAGAMYPWSEFLESRFFHEDRFGEMYANCKIITRKGKKKWILVPRMKAPMGVEDLREDGDDINIKWKGKPRNAEQKRVLREIKTAYKQGRTGFIVQASTGFGKTFLGCYAISRVKRTTLILITKEDLEVQWRKALKKFLGLKREDIGIIKADTYSVVNKKVVIGYVQSVMKDERYPSWVYKYFGMVISDEVQFMAADKFVNCMFLLPAMFRLGLTATVDRSDQKQHVFVDHIGPVHVRAELLPMRFDVIKVLTGILIPEDIPCKPGRLSTVYNYLGAIRKRQRLITNYVIRAVNRGRTVVCFAHTKKHLERAYDSLIDGGLKPKHIGYYIGGLSAEILKENAHKKVILATYKMTSYGTDYPHWDTAVFMTPVADVRQAVGRVVREYIDKKKPLMIDFVDKHWVLVNYWKKRRAWYKGRADQIKEHSYDG